MKSMNKTFIAIFVMGVVLVGTTSLAEAANTVWDDRQITNIVNDHQDQIAQNKADSINRDIAMDNRLTQVNDDLQSTKPGVLVVDKMANDAHQKALLAGALADVRRPYRVWRLTAQMERKVIKAMPARLTTARARLLSVHPLTLIPMSSRK